MTGELDRETILDHVREHDQEHVLRWLDELDAQSTRELLSQLGDVDWDRFDQFRRLVMTAATEATFSNLRPAPIERLPLRPDQVRAEARVIERGEAALRDDRVAALVVAGGQGTRLRYDHPKGMYPISPIRGKSLFQMFAEQILAARREYDCGLPWLIMTSGTNDAETREFFEQNDYFGLGKDTVHFFVQDTNPILDHNGNLVLNDKDELLVGPGGHGGTFQALAGSGLLQVLRNEGRDLISYFQVDNPLVTVADPRFLGHHLGADADFSCKVIPKRDANEGLGIAVLQDGHPAVVEYSDVPEEIASERGPNGRLRFLYGSIAIHIIDVPFVERVAQQDVLRWHVAHKQYEYLNKEGEKVYPDEKNCYKFERFIFDALAFADACAFVEVQREKEFAPVKNAEGADSPQTARHLMQRLWLQWLKQAGVDVEIPREFDEPMIEISPLFARNVDDLCEKVGPDWHPDFPVVLEE
jgi:UDP-N-acetylglucosamine/UDP-N-acetylgalactosamine diphosphorylase